VHSAQLALSLLASIVSEKQPSLTCTAKQGRAADARLMVRYHPLQEGDYGAAHGFALDVLKGTTESDPLGRGQESGEVVPRATMLSIRAIKKVADGDFQRHC
jgi:hypothetical protein